VTERLQDWLTFRSERRPDDTAIVFRGQITTYGDLERASNRLARALHVAGCRKGDRVGLLLPKSPGALAAMFGVLKADSVYVPIDTTCPPARIERILDQCEFRCLIAETSTAALVIKLMENRELTKELRVLWMDAGADLPECVMPPFSAADISKFSDAPVESASQASDPAHILFTSGSTGTPKGVVITHANIIHFVSWATAYFGIGPGQRISGHPPLHFDLSTFDVYGTIAAGATIHLLPPEVSLIPHRLAEFIRDSELTQWFSVPSALVPIAKFDVLRPNDFPALRRLLWCGERFPVPALTYLMRRLPHVSFYNLYGPTETTIASSYYHVPACPVSDNSEIPIGAACPGESLHVLDDSLIPTKCGEIGDLYIGGVGLSPGYWKDPVKTAQVFQETRHTPDLPDRVYKTGDLAKCGADGMIYLIGRSDSQVKSRGFRIELGEIETALHALPALADAAVIALDSPELGGAEICCAYVPAPGHVLAPAALKELAAAALPHYMIPTRWLVLDAMPHNGNGKADRKVLKDLFRQEAAQIVRGANS
jgi:amino acid adenylation domain-containing protein